MSERVHQKRCGLRRESPTQAGIPDLAVHVRWTTEQLELRRGSLCRPTPIIGLSLLACLLCSQHCPCAKGCGDSFQAPLMEPSEG